MKRHRRPSPRLFLKGKSPRARRRLLAVFVLIFAAAAAPGPLRSACVELSTPPPVAASVGMPIAVATGDLDRDGDLDVLVAADSSDELLWLENDGAGGGWSAHAIATGFASTEALALADFDRDGDLDLLSTTFANGDAFWLENDGSGGGWTRWTISAILNSPANAVAVDLDRDGDDDAVVAAFGSDSVSWFRNNGSGGGWTSSLIATGTSNPRWIAPADVDRDGDPDLLVAFQGGSAVVAFENDGAGGGWARQTLSSASQPNVVVAADLDGDGDLDAAATFDDSDTVAWFENDGAGGGWTALTVSDTVDYAYALAAVDLDGDGDLDLLSGGLGGAAVFWHENLESDASSWRTHTVTTASVGFKAVAGADLDGDGDDDVVAANRELDFVSWHRNDRIHGAALFGPVRSISTAAESARSLVVGDLDRDGDLEPGIVNGNDSSIDFWRNDDNGDAWTKRQFTGFLNGGSDAALVDLDLDGDLDAVGATDEEAALLWFRNEGSFGSSNFFVDTVLIDPTAVAVGDFGGSAFPDLAVADRTLDAVLWYPNDGTPATGAWTRATVAASLDALTALLATDLDRDGDLDLVAARTIAGSGVLWFESNGASSPTWTRHTLLTSDGKANQLQAADVDRDGDLDLVTAVSDNSSPFVLWLENDDTPAVGAWTLHTLALPAGTSASDLALADLDRDGDLDLALTVVGSGLDQVLVAPNDGAGGFALASIATVGAPQEIAAADLDRDGDLDLVVGTATALVWLPNLGTRVHDDGFDSGDGTTCWSNAVP